MFDDDTNLNFSEPTTLLKIACTGEFETRFAAMCAHSWSNVDSRCQSFTARRGPVVHRATRSNVATSCSRPMKLLHYVSQAPHTNICNSIMHKDLQNVAISLNESNLWRSLITKVHTWLQTWFQTPPVHDMRLTGDTRKIFVSRPSTSLTRCVSR